MKKFISILLVLLLAVGIMPINVFADSLYPEIYKDEVNVRVGSTIYTTFTYGSTATSASLVASNGNIDASIEGNMLKIYGANEGFSFITLYFNDGRNDTIKVNIVRSGKNSYDESIEVVKNRYKNISIDMTPYNATNATVSYDSSKLSVNKSSFSSSGVLRITGKNTGYSVVKITYNTGEIEIYNVTVTEKEVDSHSNYDTSVEVNQSLSMYVDLSIYGASSANFDYNPYYISLNRTYIYGSENISITGKHPGHTYIVINYGNGNKEVIGVDVTANNNIERKDYSYAALIKENESVIYSIDLDKYNSRRAVVTFDNDIVSVNKNAFYESADLVITGRYAGKTNIKIEYDNGKTEYVLITVNKVNIEYDVDYVSTDSIALETGETLNFKVVLGDYDKAVISTDVNSVVSVSSYTLTHDDVVIVSARRIGDGNITITYDGDIKVTIPVSVRNRGYKIPTVSIDTTDLAIGEKAIITVNMGSENSNASVKLNPEYIKIGVSNYLKDKIDYTIYSSRNSVLKIEFEAVEAVDETEIVLKLPEGLTYTFKLSVVKTRLQETDGVTRDNKHFLIKENLSINESVLNKGYIAGKAPDLFGVDDNITRQEFVVILARILDYTGDTKDITVPEDVKVAWSIEGIKEMMRAGVVDTDELFRPDDAITRYEVMEMLYRVIDLSAYSTECGLVDLTNSDLDKKVGQCCNAGIISGYPDGTFGGERNITRSEAIVMINRIFYGSNESTKVNRFKDVREDFWAYKDIVKAMEEK